MQKIDTSLSLSFSLSLSLSPLSMHSDTHSLILVLDNTLFLSLYPRRAQNIPFIHLFKQAIVLGLNLSHTIFP